MKNLIICLFVAVSFWPAPLTAQRSFSSEKHDFKVVTLFDNLEHPWSLAFLPNGDYLVTERPGRLNWITKKDRIKRVVKGTPDVANAGQGGLLDVMVHPNFAQNRVIYLSYSASRLFAMGTEVVRGTLSGDKFENAEVIFRAAPKTRNTSVHFGSRLLWGPDDKLYITLGERGKMHEAQKPENHLGSLIRLNPDGSIPDDNPFLGKEGYRPEIYSYGHRNAQGIDARPGTDEVWLHEHGPKGGDEVNIIKAGANYGWPEITYGIDYSGLPITDKTEAPGMEQPALYWDPSIAPSGMTFYTGSQFPEWQGDLFVGALVLTHLRRIEFEGNKPVHQEVLLKDMGERIRDVRTGPDGYLYLLTDDTYGRLLRLEPK